MWQKELGAPILNSKREAERANASAMNHLQRQTNRATTSKPNSAIRRRPHIQIPEMMGQFSSVCSGSKFQATVYHGGEGLVEGVSDTNCITVRKQRWTLVFDSHSLLFSQPRTPAYRIADLQLQLCLSTSTNPI